MAEGNSTISSFVVFFFFFEREKNKKKRGKERSHWGSNKGKDPLLKSTLLKCDREKLDSGIPFPPSPKCNPHFCLPQTDGEKIVEGHLVSPI